jgi:hypothetical protein
MLLWNGWENPESRLLSGGSQKRKLRDKEVASERNLMLYDRRSIGSQSSQRGMRRRWTENLTTIGRSLVNLLRQATRSLTSKFNPSQESTSGTKRRFDRYRKLVVYYGERETNPVSVDEWRRYVEENKDQRFVMARIMAATVAASEAIRQGKILAYPTPTLFIKSSEMLAEEMPTALPPTSVIADKEAVSCMPVQINDRAGVAIRVYSQDTTLSQMLLVSVEKAEEIRDAIGTAVANAASKYGRQDSDIPDWLKGLWGTDDADTSRTDTGS